MYNYLLGNILQYLFRNSYLFLPFIFNIIVIITYALTPICHIVGHTIEDIVKGNVNGKADKT